MSVRLDHAKVKNLKLKFKKEKVLDRCPVNPAQVEVGAAKCVEGEWGES